MPRSSLVFWLCLALLAGLALLSPLAHGGENALLGTITSTGTSVTNVTTGSPFVIGTSQRLTIVCDAAAFILTDSTAVTTANGLPVAASEKLPTSVSNTLGYVSGVPTALIAVISSSGTANCKVWRRTGTE